MHASVKHSQSNGQVEVPNKTVISGLKKRLDALQGKYTEEQENVLCALRTTAKVATEETPFKLVYGSENVAPTEIVVASHRVEHFEETTNNDELLLELDLVDEKRWASEQLQTKMCLATAQYYKKLVLSRQFFVGGGYGEETNSRYKTELISCHQSEKDLIRSSVYPTRMCTSLKTNMGKG